jgi:TonB family protein
VPTIYLADRDPTCRKSLAHALRRRGIQVKEFASGIELYASAVMEKPDLVVLETELEDMDGFDVFTRLRRRARRPLPVVFVTAFENPGVATSCLRRGALAYLGKGRALEEVVQEVEECLAQVRSAAVEARELSLLAADRYTEGYPVDWREAEPPRLEQARDPLLPGAIAERRAPEARVPLFRSRSLQSTSRARRALARHATLLRSRSQLRLSRGRAALGRQAAALRSGGTLVLSLARLEAARRAASMRSFLDLSLERARHAASEQLLLALWLSGHWLGRMQLALAAEADRFRPRLQRAAEALRIRSTWIEGRLQASHARARLLLERATDEATRLIRRLPATPPIPATARRAMPVIGLLGLLAAQILVSGRSPRTPTGSAKGGLSPVHAVLPDGPGSNAGNGGSQKARGATLPDARVGQPPSRDAEVTPPAPKPAPTAKRSAGHRRTRVAPVERAVARPAARVESQLEPEEPARPPRVRVSETPVARPETPVAGPEAPTWLRGPAPSRTSRVGLETASGRLDLILARDERARLGGRSPTLVTLGVLVDPSGRVAYVRLLEPSGDGGIDRKAIEMVQSVAYDPATRGGRTVPAWARQDVLIRSE